MQKHADKGNAEAMTVLGRAYCDGGKGLEQDQQRAFQLYESAAAQGYVQAQTQLGHCYQDGEGVEINHETAAQWFRRAAEQGLPHAQSILGALFFVGMGVAQSYGEAVKWWRLAAAQGDDCALFGLGICHAKGACRWASTWGCASSSAPSQRAAPKLRRRSKSSRQRR